MLDKNNFYIQCSCSSELLHIDQFLVKIKTWLKNTLKTLLNIVD